MANEEHLAILKQGVDAWNQWRGEKPGISPDLSEANLSGMDLSKANLSGMDLSGANLTKSYLREADLSRAELYRAYLRNANLNRANLNRADLSWARLDRAYLSGVYLNNATLCDAVLVEANLSWAHLGGADLSRTYLSGTNLKGTNLSGANLSGANLSGANLSGTKFTEVTLGMTTLGDLDLSQVEGLVTVKHIGPSYLDIQTIYRSGGKIPEVFLRGAGVPDNFIEYIISLTSQALEFYSCFISYASPDDIFVRRLYADLQNEGIRCWFAPEDMKIGDEIRPAIDQAIRIHDKLLLVLSEHSINSNWVQKEVETAFDIEIRQGRKILFPVRLDDAVMETELAWAADVRRQRHIGDLTQWKDHDNYRSGFERLLKDLRAD